MIVHHLAWVPWRFSSLPFAAGAPIATWFESRALLRATCCLRVTDARQSCSRRDYQHVCFAAVRWPSRKISAARKFRLLPLSLRPRLTRAALSLDEEADVQNEPATATREPYRSTAMAGTMRNAEGRAEIGS
jgi:hypothetical protein